MQKFHITLTSSEVMISNFIGTLPNLLTVKVEISKERVPLQIRQTNVGRKAAAFTDQ